MASSSLDPAATAEATAAEAAAPEAAPEAAAPEAAAPEAAAAWAEAAGLFGPGSEAWRLDREAFLLLGAGPRALLMQLAHPLVAEGVDQHSDFRADPWARLQGTLHSYLRLIYGTRTEALEEVRRLNALHRTITGAVQDEEARTLTGQAAYRARDPDLSLWVHATLVDSTLAVNDAWAGPLSIDRAARFYAETLPLGRAFGIPADRLPPDLAAFETYMHAMLGPDGPIHPTPTARELARSVLEPTLAPLHPALSVLPVPAYAWTLWPAIGLLPEELREAYRLPWTPARRATAAWLVRGWRIWAPRLPASFREMPQARAADRRMTELSTRPGSASRTGV